VRVGVLRLREPAPDCDAGLLRVIDAYEQFPAIRVREPRDRLRELPGADLDCLEVEEVPLVLLVSRAAWSTVMSTMSMGIVRILTASATSFKRAERPAAARLAAAPARANTVLGP
jgi:hypothetical protein